MQVKDLPKLLVLLKAVVEQGRLLQENRGLIDFPVWYTLDRPITFIEFSRDIGCYRLAPLQVLRPWQPSATEIPVGAMYRKKGEHSYCSMIVGFTPKGVTTAASIEVQEADYSFKEMLEKFEWSRNGEKWYPCGVEVEEETED